MAPRVVPAVRARSWHLIVRLVGSRRRQWRRSQSMSPAPHRRHLSPDRERQLPPSAGHGDCLQRERLDQAQLVRCAAVGSITGGQLGVITIDWSAVSPV